MKYNRFSILKRLKAYFKIYPCLLIGIGIISVLTTTVSLISPYLYKILIDDVMSQGKLDLLKYVIVSMIGVFIVGTIMSAINTYFNNKLVNRVNLSVKQKLFAKLLSRDIATTYSIDVGNLNMRIEKDGGVISSFLVAQIVSFVCSFLFAIIYLTLMLIISPWLALISVFFIPVAIVFGRYTGKKFNKYRKELWNIGSKNKSFLFDTIQKWREVKSYTLETNLVHDYIEMLKPELGVNLKWMKFYALNNLFYAFKNNFVQNLVLYFVGGLLIIIGNTTIGSLLMFMSYMASLSSNVDTIINSITDFSGNKAVFERLFDLLNEIPKNRKDKNLITPNIKFNNVGFAYSEKSPMVLSDVSFDFEFGKKYLVIGKSGEGKSTLIKLILCLVVPTNGKLLADEIDIDDISQQSVFQSIGTVMQENIFFNLSIKENFKLISPTSNDEDIQRAASLACIDDFIESLPDKYDTVIGERGIKLSGGQKQQLAIARLILHNPQVAILDEATSSLDSVTESKILTNLNEIFKDKTLIVISHKPALQIAFDTKIKIEGTKLCLV